MAQVNVRKAVEWLVGRRTTTETEAIKLHGVTELFKTESTNLKMMNSMHGKALQSRSIIILISIEIYFACFKSMLATVLVRKTVD